MYYGTLTVNNCIFWDGGINSGYDSTRTVTYSDVQGGWPTGEGNIDADPLFYDHLGPDGIAGTGDEDLHLLPNSPCIDAGDPNSPWGNEPWPNGARINMGAYGNTPEAALSRAGLQFAGFKIMSETRLRRTVFRYVLSLSLTNITESDVTNVYVNLIDASQAVTNVVDGEIIFPVIEANGTADSNNVGDYFTIDVDHSQLIGTGRLTWQVDFNYLGEPRMLMMSANIPMGTNEVAGDITGDGKVDYEDLDRLAEQWLWTGEAGSTPEDIVKDGSVDFLDFAALAENWMK